MNGFTLMAFRLLAAAGLLAFFLWQLRRNGFDALSAAGPASVWLIGGLCALACVAVVAAVASQARLTRSDAFALVLGVFGVLAALLSS